MKLREIKNILFATMGILTKRKVFCGPRTAQIFISDLCSESCPWCGLYSPFRKDQLEQTEREKFMDFSLLKALVDELSQIGTFRIELFGNGEPFLHPNIIEIIRYIKRTPMECSFTTNGLLLNTNLAQDIARLGVHAGVGLHAASYSIWSKIFNKHSKEDFNKIIDIINIFNHTTGSKVTLNFVISSINYLEIVDFINLAIKTGCYAVNFCPVSIFAGTEFLQLNMEQSRILKNIILRAGSIAKRHALKTNLYSTSLVSFPEQVKSFSTQGIYQKTPCYIGWFKTSITVGGSVFPCCNFRKEIMGNLKEKKFKEIWVSDKYKKFRHGGLFSSRRASSCLDKRCSSCADYYSNSAVDELMHLRFWHWRS